MDKLFASTSAITTNINTMKNYQTYYQNKQKNFIPNSYSSSGTPVSTYLGKINKNYITIAKNIGNVAEYLREYAFDLEAIEENLSNSGQKGLFDSSTRGIVGKYRNSLSKLKLYDEKIFPIEHSSLIIPNLNSIQKTSFGMDNLNAVFANFKMNLGAYNTQYDNMENVESDAFQSLLHEYEEMYQKEIEEYDGLLDTVNEELNKLLPFEKQFARANELAQNQKRLVEADINKLISDYKNFGCTDSKLKELGITKKELATLSTTELLKLCQAKDSDVKKMYATVNKSESDLTNAVKASTNFANYQEFSKRLNELKSDKATLEASIEKTKELKSCSLYELLPLTEDYQNYNYKEASIKDIGKKEISPLEQFRTLNQYANRDQITIEHKGELESLLKASKSNPELAKMYNYLWEKRGEEAAEEYLLATKNNVNQMNGYLKAQKFLNGLEDEKANEEITKKLSSFLENHAKVAGKGLGDGTESFFGGFANAIKGVGAYASSLLGIENNLASDSRIYSEDEYESMYILEALQNTEKYNKILDNNYEISQSIGNMIPSMALGILCTPAVGSVSMGISAGGSSYHSAMVEGKDLKNSVLYGVVSGVSETTMERFLGAIPGLSDVNVTGLKTFAQSMLKEGVEEGTQEYVDALTRYGIFKEDIDLQEVTENAKKSAIYGAITGGILNSPNLVISEVNTQMNKQKLETPKVQTQDKINGLKYNNFSLPQSIRLTLESNLKKYVYKNTNNFVGVNEGIEKNGLYHFTSAADQILQSGYIKPSGINASYGNPKTFFFSGVPEVGAFATNLDYLPLTATAVKVMPTTDIIESSKLKIRNLDDHAISYDGKFDLTNQEASKEYFVLKQKQDELVYESVSKDVYDHYKNTEEGKKIEEYVNNKKNVQSIKDSYLNSLFENKNTLELVNDSKPLKIKQVKNATVRGAKLIGGTAGLVAFTSLVSSGPIGAVLSVPLALKSISLMNDGFYNNNIKDSILMTADSKMQTADGKTEQIIKLNQNVFSYNDFIKSRFSDNPQEYFLVRSLNAFQQLEKNHKYGTTSQANTFMLLRQMQKLGFIKNLTKTPSTKETNLAVARFALGIEQRQRNVKMYEMTFETTDKKIDYSVIENILKLSKVDTSKYNIRTNSKGNTILDLKIDDKIKNKIKSIFESKESHFIKTLTQDGKSDPKLVKLVSDYLLDSAKKGNTEATAIRELLLNMKDQIHFYETNEGSYENNGNVYLNADKKNSRALFHEMGHAFFEKVLNEKLPDDYQNIIGRAIKNVNSEKIISLQEQIEKSRNECLNDAQKSVMKQYNVSTLDEVVTKELQNYNKTNFTQIKENLFERHPSLKEHLKDISGAELREQVATYEVSDKITKLTYENMSKKYPDLIDLSSIICSVYKNPEISFNQNEKYRLRYGHSAEYYENHPIGSDLISFHEMFATYTSLILTDKKYLTTLKEIFGDEFSDMLKKTFESLGPDVKIAENSISSSKKLDDNVIEVLEADEATDILEENNAEELKEDKSDIRVDSITISNEENLNTDENITEEVTVPLNNEKKLPDLNVLLTNYQSHNVLNAMSNKLISTMHRFIYTDTNYFKGLNDKILKEGLYYFSSEKDIDKIMSSQLLKNSNSVMNFGKKIFFAGIPEVGAVATNLNDLPVKITALKVNPGLETITSSKLKVRNLDDSAIIYEGDWNLKNAFTSKEYFVLVQQEGKLKYKKVSKYEYDTYENFRDNSYLANFIKEKKISKIVARDWYDKVAHKIEGAELSEKWDISNPTNSTTTENLNYIKYEILSLIDSKWSILEKSRKIYYELNKRVHYDTTFMDDNEENLGIKATIYNKNLNFQNLESNNVICKGWSQLYAELLIASGIEEKNVSIIGGDSVGSHKWVEVKVDENRVIVADATDAINKSNDLVNCKCGFATAGFVYGYMNKLSHKRLVNLDNSVLAQYGTTWANVDKKIGVKENEYFDKLLEKANNVFKPSTENTDTVDLIKDFENTPIPEYMDGFEARVYFSNLKYILFNKQDNIKVSTATEYIKADDKTIPLCIITVSKDNGTDYIVYDQKNGKKMFDNHVDYENYIQSIGVIGG